MKRVSFDFRERCIYATHGYAEGCTIATSGFII